MTTIKRFRNKFSLQVRERDHNPPHVHLFGGGFDVMIDLRTFTAAGVWPAGLEEEITAWVIEHQADLMKEWLKWHT